jgi:hypothetical protein
VFQIVSELLRASELYVHFQQVIQTTQFYRQKKTCASAQVGETKHKNFLMFTHQYLWDLDCSNLAASLASQHSQQFSANCNQLCDS